MQYNAKNGEVYFVGAMLFFDNLALFLSAALQILPILYSSSEAVYAKFVNYCLLVLDAREHYC